MDGNHSSAKEIPLPALKTVKIKQAEPYYRSLKEHCWVSRERETEKKREGEGEREITLVRIWPSQCVQKWKAWNWIPAFLWLYDRRVRNAAALHVIPYYLNPACDGSSTHTPLGCTLGFRRDWFTLHIFGPPTQLQQAACSIQVFSPSLGAKDSTLGSGKGANHMLAPSLAPDATNTLWRWEKAIHPLATN